MPDNHKAEGHVTDLAINPLFARPGEARSVERYRLGEKSMLPATAYQFVHDEAMLDGNARLNLATFVGTWMDDEARRLYAESFDKNMIDKDEYPQTAAVEERCWKIIADLWHAPDPAQSIGCSTIGSSEACMLGGLALKRRWQEARRAQGKPVDRPNLVMSSAVQVVWEKFCNFWDVEARYVPISEEHKTLDGHDLASYVDENTIGVVAILGVTYTGMYEPVAQISAALDQIQRDTGLDVRIHVDGASGAMVAPFLQPDLEWDFRVPRVVSINTSGHKYGLVYPGLGWVVWRTREWLPESLVFKVSYLGGDMPTFALNFSRPGNQIIGQYYNFVRLGRAGYTAIMEALRDTALEISAGLAEDPAIEILADGSAIPVIAFDLKGDPGFTVFQVSHELRARGWQVPAYTMPPDAEDVAVLRIVVRDGFNADLASDLVADIRAVCAELAAAEKSDRRRSHFAH